MFSTSIRITKLFLLLTTTAISDPVETIIYPTDCTQIVSTSGKPQIILKFRKGRWSEASLLFYSGPEVRVAEHPRAEEVNLEGFYDEAAKVGALVSHDGVDHSMLKTVFIGFSGERKILGGTRHRYESSRDEYERIGSSLLLEKGGLQAEGRYFDLYVIEVEQG